MPRLTRIVANDHFAVRACLSRLTVMKFRYQLACILLTALTWARAVPAAETFKCIDTDGNVSYQDVNCDPAQTSRPINQTDANWLPMGISRDNAKLLSAFEAAQKRARQQRRRRLDRTLLKWKTQARRCKSLRARYYELEDSQLLHSVPGRTGKASKMFDRMRKACAD